jgi:hypothetical protein
MSKIVNGMRDGLLVNVVRELGYNGLGGMAKERGIFRRSKFWKRIWVLRKMGARGG